MNFWKRQRKIATLPTARVDATLALARVLEKAQAGQIASVYIGIEWKDGGSFCGDYSSMNHKTLAMHAATAQRELMEVLGKYGGSEGI